MGTAHDSSSRYRPLRQSARPSRRQGAHGARVGAVALTALGVLGGVASGWSAQHEASPPLRVMPVDTTTPIAPSDQSVSAVPRVAPAASTNSAGQLTPQQQQLMGLLPPGYNQSSCQSVTPAATGAIATVDCYNNSLPGGPALARYSLFPDQQTLENTFTSNLVGHLNVQSSCPDGGASPGSWHYQSTPNQSAGSLVCATDPDNGNNATLGWTDDGALTMSCAEGPDIGTLFRWWAAPAPSLPSNRIAGP